MMVRAMAMLAAITAMACQESMPVAPEIEEAAVAGPEATVASCPCWDAGRLQAAFPAVHFYRGAGDAASLTRFAHADAQQIQAIVRFAEDAGGSCELATFGSAGRIEALAASEDLSASQCAACAALLERSATAHGLVGRKPIE